MSRYSKSFSPKSTQFWFVPSECPSNPLHFKGQSLLHNHILLSLMGNSDFLSRPKFAIDSVKSWPSNCFFFRNEQPKVFHHVPNRKLPASGAVWKKRLPFGLSQKRNWLKVLRNFNFLTHIINQTCFSP